MADIGNIGSSVSASFGSPVGSQVGSQVGSSSSSAATSGVNAASVRRNTEPTSTSSRIVAADRVEVSEVARWLGEMNRLPPIREAKVAEAKAAIANGTLDTDDKLSVAIGRMIDDIG